MVDKKVTRVYIMPVATDGENKQSTKTQYIYIFFLNKDTIVKSEVLQKMGKS